MSESRQIYETELPPADDPDVVELAAEFVATAKANQKPMPGLAVGVVLLLIGVVIWGELNRLAEFDMPWLVMGGSAVVLGGALGYPFRRIGRLFDAHWAAIAALFGFLMGVLGDTHALALLGAENSHLGWAEFLSQVDPEVWWQGRQPIDWLVAALGGIGAYAAARPALDARQLLMEARIAIHLEDLAEEAETEA